MRIIDVTWHDTGNNKSYERTKKLFKNDIVANKSDEAIFIDSGKCFSPSISTIIEAANGLSWYIVQS